jgi:uncharacterized membrane protein
MDKYPVQYSVSYPAQQSRVLAFFSLPFFLARWILLIPALIVVYVLGILAFFAAWIAMWGIVFTGHYPKSLHEFVSGYVRWQVRVSSYMMGLTDKYPPFRMSA